MTSAPPAWKRERHGRMEAARSLLRPSPAPSPVRSEGSSETAMWASPSAARVRTRPSNLRSAVRASPSFVSVERATVQSRTTQATQTRDGDGSPELLNPGDGIHLGAFGQVGEMTAETVDFLIRVLEDRKQELLVADDTGLRVRAKYDDEDSGSEVTQRAPASEVARLQLGSADSGGAGVTELVRSHSYEALVQLEGILEARHRKIMNDGLLEAGDNCR
ncbi:hypothetical protein KRP22_000417 [Phytophthora ramorum]|nr:hypothetical protein KRP22_12363 [Phytophthora ramorum]